MTQYIEKSTIMAEIKKLIRENELYLYEKASDVVRFQKTGAYSVLNDLLHFIDTLEVKEEILDENGKPNLMQKSIHEAFKRGYDMGVLQTTKKMNHNTKEVDLEKEINLWFDYGFPNDEELLDYIKETAKHFFELGLKKHRKET